MAFGTLAFDTLQTSDSKKTGTNKTLDTSFVYNGSAKAWSRVDPNTISDSFNVSSLTDQGTGLFEDNFINAFSDATYSSVASPGGSTNIQMMFATAALFRLSVGSLFHLLFGVVCASCFIQV